MRTKAPRLVHSLVLLEPVIIPPAMAPVFTENTAPILAAHRAGDARRAVDLWMKLVSMGENWCSMAKSTVPGGAEQAEKDASTFFDVELPSVLDWVFDADRASRISQPVLYVLGGESGPRFEARKQHFPIADFLSRHPF